MGIFVVIDKDCSLVVRGTVGFIAIGDDILSLCWPHLGSLNEHACEAWRDGPNVLGIPPSALRPPGGVRPGGCWWRLY